MLSVVLHRFVVRLAIFPNNHIYYSCHFLVHFGSNITNSAHIDELHMIDLVEGRTHFK